MTASTAIVEMKEEGENSLQNCYINGLLQTTGRSPMAGSWLGFRPCRQQYGRSRNL